MKLSILGGGGFRTPYVYNAILNDTGTPRVDEIALHDIDEQRLHTMAQLLAELGQGRDDAPKVTVTTSMATAIEGSDFVFAAIRVGGLQGRQCDEHVALDLGVLGQETTGPGGLSYALRTVPVMMEAARLTRELAPQAYLINFTNPAGIITEALQQVLGDRVLGICDTPSGLGRRAAGLLSLPGDRVQMDYVGLNHLGWMRRIMHDGVDVLPTLLASDRLGELEEAAVFGTDWLRTMGSIPNEYLYYYYDNREAVRSIVAAQVTRGDFLASSQGAFYAAAAQRSSGLVDLWQETVARRSASYMAEAKGATQDDPGDDSTHDTEDQGYADVALGVMTAISRNERTTMILNVRNRGTVACLPYDAVVEVPTMVDANGVHPLTVSQPDLHQAGLMQQVKAVEQLTIEAALTGSHEAALKAFAWHPLVDSVDVARDLLAGYIARIPEVARTFAS